MAQENVKLFNEKLMESEELRAKLKAAEEAYTGDKADKEKAVSEILIPLANEVGLPFTIDELKAAEESMSADGELDDDELAVVAGGKGGCFILGINPGNRDFACSFVGGTRAGSANTGFCIIIGVDRI